MYSLSLIICTYSIISFFLDSSNDNNGDEDSGFHILDVTEDFNSENADMEIVSVRVDEVKGR